MLTRKEQELLDALEPRAEAEGIEIVTVEVVGSKKAPTIRVYIDTENGVSFDELASSQVWVNQIMDELDPFPGAYTLEVSSPGIDRPLRTPQHFADFAGETVNLRLDGNFEGKNKWQGQLEGFADDCVILTVDGIEYKIPYSDIKRANVKGVIDFNA